jgi:hypothetical protein
MNLVCLALAVASLADARPAPDGGIPPWAPALKRPHVEDSASYGLHRSGEGYVWANDRFEARVANDGVVTFKDKHGSASGSAFSFALGRKNRAQPNDRGSLPRRDEPPPILGPTWALPSQSSKERSIPWDEVCPPKVPCHLSPAPGMLQVSGSFDLTDEFVRMLGHHPNQLEKARFLSATFEFRIQLAAETRRADLKRALDKLPERLDELWNDGRYSSRERRRLLYELWADLDQTGDGEKAAAIILRFIRRRLPCGTSDAYSKDELDAFAKARPAQHFLLDDGCGH